MRCWLLLRRFGLHADFVIDKLLLEQSIKLDPMWATVREYRIDSGIQHSDRGYVYGKLFYNKDESMLYIESTTPTALYVANYPKRSSVSPNKSVSRVVKGLPLFDEDNPNDDAIPDWNEIPATINASGTVLAVNASGRNLPNGYRSFDLQTASYMSYGAGNEVFTVRVIVDNGKRWRNVRFPDRGAVLTVHGTLLGRDETAGFLCVSLMELDFSKISASVSTSKTTDSTPKKVGLKNIKLPSTPRSLPATPAERRAPATPSIKKSDNDAVAASSSGRQASAGTIPNNRLEHHDAVAGLDSTSDISTFSEDDTPTPQPKHGVKRNAAEDEGPKQNAKTRKVTKAEDGKPNTRSRTDNNGKK